MTSGLGLEVGKGEEGSVQGDVEYPKRKNKNNKHGVLLRFETDNSCLILILVHYLRIIQELLAKA